MSTFNNPKSNFGDLAKKMGIGGNEEKTQLRTAPPLSNTVKKNTATVISSDVVIIGNIKSREDFELNGEVMGDIESQGTIRINGKVKGDVKAVNVLFQHASYTGDIVSDSKVMIDCDTSITGDISAKMVTIDGYLKGNTVADEEVTINAQAVVQGNITARQISIAQGALIVGSIETKAAPEPSEIEVDRSAFINETTSSILAGMENEEEPEDSSEVIA